MIGFTHPRRSTEVNLLNRLHAVNLEMFEFTDEATGEIMTVVKTTDPYFYYPVDGYFVCNASNVVAKYEDGEHFHSDVRRQRSLTPIFIPPHKVVKTGERATVLLSRSAVDDVL